jgi:ribosomal protection tetracycline resistance protein
LAARPTLDPARDPAADLPSSLPSCRSHPTLNLGIVAHVDAGKTSLTERLLLEAGVIDELGSVDDGSTQTDTLALERQRGITIRAAVVSFELGPPGSHVTVNLVDTPGHSDFIAEVERSLAVLDGAILVMSAVEGVQAQTRVLMRVLRRLRIPTVLYVNKIDRMGARDASLLDEIAERLTPRVVAMGEVTQAGTSSAAYVPYAADGAFRDRLAETLAEVDDALLADWVERPATVTAERLLGCLAEQTARAQVHPVFLGSAITGAGVAELTEGLTRLLPLQQGDADGPLAGTVFKVDRGPSGEKVALVHLRSGTLRVRDRVEVGPAESGRGVEHSGPQPDGTAVGLPTRREEKVTAIGVYEGGAVARRGEARAGRIARVVGLEGARIGDVVGDRSLARPLTHEFAPPTLETVVDPRDPAERGLLHAALTRLAEQDPLIDLRQDDLRGEISVSLYGEVQKEVIEATLAADHGVAVTFRPSTTICVERVTGTGAAFEIIATPTNPFLATVGLRVEPGMRGSGVEIRLEVELGSMPAAFFRAVHETVHETLRQGLHGWDVPDAVVVITHSGYFPRQSHMHATFDKTMSSTAGDFRNLTPLVLMSALRRAGTMVEEPVHRFDLDLPSDVLGQALTALAHVRAVPRETEVRGAVTHLSGEVPAGRVHELQRRVPGLTRGQGDLVCVFEGHRAVSGAPPERPRTDLDPLHRREYLLRVAGRI